MTTVTINPRPTATLSSTNSPGVFTDTGCNVSNQYRSEERRVGKERRSVKWDDGFTKMVGTGPGPYTNARTVLPFAPLQNVSSNNAFYVTNVSDANHCFSRNQG